MTSGYRKKVFTNRYKNPTSVLVNKTSSNTAFHQAAIEHNKLISQVPTHDF